MNYPIWHVAFGAGALIATVAILHVFVSHFAVGSGLFLVLTERRARRNDDQALLKWLKFHNKFFVLASVVFGAISGVGIWFTIGLISPVATSNLIHIYVWGWAIEWVFFFLEITASLLYLYGWEKLSPGLHQWFGWVYFINAYLSLVIINGIITFMLTPGNWINNHQFWSGFFNPTYFASLALRTVICLALAGIYALITASVQKDIALKTRIVRWAALWTVPCLAILPLMGRWYISSIPADLWASARGPMPTGTQFASYAIVFLIVSFALALFALFAPGKIHLAFSLLVLLLALGTMGSFEFVREAIRKPFVIQSYLYANSLYKAQMPGDGGFSVDEVNAAGILNSAHWIKDRELTPDNQVAIGKEIFHVECESCHTANAYRGLKSYLALRQWDESKIRAMLGGLEFMHNNVMPPFAGTDAERDALAAYLDTLRPSPMAGPVATDGRTVFEQNCSMCHQVKSIDPLFINLPKDPSSANEALKDLPTLFPLMPDLKLTDGQRTSLVEWLDTQRSGMGITAAAQGGN